MTKQEADFIGSMNMCDEISNEAYKKIMCHCEVEEQQPCEKCEVGNPCLYCEYDFTEKKTKEPCEDCISREAVIRLAEQYPLIIGSRCSGLIADIKHLPSVTPQPKKGKWIEEGKWSEGCGMGETYGSYWRCSSCDEITQGDYYQCGANYCPNCGADMRGEKE